MSAWSERAGTALASLADLLWPPVCAACPRALPLPPDRERAQWSSYFCPPCLSTVELLPAALCPVCARPFYYSAGHICGDCQADPPPFKTTRAAAVYQGAAARAIGRLKYHGDLTQVRPLAALAAAEGITAEEDEIIVPAPLSPRRLAERGFNQALVLARAVFGARSRPIETSLLKRSAEVAPHQASLNRRQRRQAIRGSFQVPAPDTVRGAKILLFDDVVTTGATAAEAARTLLAAGAAEVRLAAVARTVLDTWR